MTNLTHLENPRELLHAVLRVNFLSFVEYAFAYIHQGQRLRHGEHLELLCHWLTNVSEGECRRLIINMPPRTLKSFVTSVCWIAWELGHHPGKSFIVVTHNQALGRVLADQTRRIMEAPWYKELFPKTRIRSDFSQVLHFKTSAGGGRLAVGIGSGVTGQGGDALIVDDSIDAEDATYESRRNHVNQTFDTAIQSRINNRSKAAFVVLGQRLHEDDLCGHLDRKGSFQKLAVPLIAKEPMTYQVGDFTWWRPEGHVLDPVSNTPEAVDILIAENSAGDFEAQYQQNPIPPSGEHLDLSWFPRWNTIPKSANQCVMSWDLASSVGENSSYSGCLVIKTDWKSHYVEHIWRGKLEFNPLTEVAEELIKRFQPDAILVEMAALGPALHDVLKDTGHRPIGIPTPSDSKIVRGKRHLVKFKSGSVILPENHAFLGELLNELMAFPHGLTDDLLDCLTQYLSWQEVREGLKPPPAIARSRSHRTVAGRPMSPTPIKYHPQRNPKAIWRPRF